jgi:hypothetical protein
MGGAIERRYRSFRPELEQLPWGTLAEAHLSDGLRQRAQSQWLRVCLNEYQSAGGIAQTLDTFITAQVPIDLSGVLSRFVVDEISHAELAARIVGELRGPGDIAYAPPEALLQPPSRKLRPLMRAAYYMMRGFCTGEALSLAIVRATAKVETQPLVSAAMKRIAKDEAAHGAFGWVFFDWALEQFSKSEILYLRKQARIGLENIVAIINECDDHEEECLGWLPAPALREVCIRALEEEISPALRERGLYPA